MVLVRQPYFVTRQPAARSTETGAERVYRLPVDAYATDDSVVLTASVACRFQCVSGNVWDGSSFIAKNNR